eukprot:7391440-Prymnesium_polylepis.1
MVDGSPLDGIYHRTDALQVNQVCAQRINVVIRAPDAVSLRLLRLDQLLLNRVCLRHQLAAAASGTASCHWHRDERCRTRKPKVASDGGALGLHVPDHRVRVQTTAHCHGRQLLHAFVLAFAWMNEALANACLDHQCLWKHLNPVALGESKEIAAQHARLRLHVAQQLMRQHQLAKLGVCRRRPACAALLEAKRQRDAVYRTAHAQWFMRRHGVSPAPRAVAILRHPNEIGDPDADTLEDAVQLFHQANAHGAHPNLLLQRLELLGILE